MCVESHERVEPFAVSIEMEDAGSVILIKNLHVSASWSLIARQDNKWRWIWITRWFRVQVLIQTSPNFTSALPVSQVARKVAQVNP